MIAVGGAADFWARVKDGLESLDGPLAQWEHAAAWRPDAMPRMREPADLVWLDAQIGAAAMEVSIGWLESEWPLAAMVVVQDAPGGGVEWMARGVIDVILRSRMAGASLGETWDMVSARAGAWRRLRDNLARTQRQLGAIADYVFTVIIEAGRPVATYHAPGCLAVTGYTPSDYSADPFLWHRMIHEEDRPQVLDAVNRVLAGAPGPPIEHRIIHRDGSVRWVRNSTLVHRNAAGQIHAYDGLIKDITEDRAKTEALARERILLRTLIDSMPDFIYAKDMSSRFIVANRAVARHMGALGPDQLLGKTDFDFYAADLARQYFEDERRVLSSAQPLISQEEFSVDVHGSPRWISSTKVPLRDASGSVTGLISVGRDVTEERRAQRQLEQFFRLTLDLLSVANFEGRFLRLNPAWEETLGYSRSELLDQPYIGFVHPSDQEATRAVAERLSAGDVVVTFENRYRCRDGSYKWLLWNACPSLAERLIYATARDITERKSAEAELQQAYGELAHRESALRQALEELRQTHRALKASQLVLIQAEKMESLGTLAAGIAHEVKNPLQILLTGVQVLQGQLAAAPGPAAQVLQDMREAVHRADGIVRMLLNYASAHHLEPQVQPLGPIIENASGLVKYPLQQHRVDFEKDVPESLPDLSLDRAKMEQVFVNIFMNAIDAMPDGGRLAVKARAVREAPEGLDREFPPGAELVQISILDTGSGISEECLAKVFDPFFTTKPVGQGTGLGLSVVRQIITWHGGHVRIGNRLPRGARVDIYLSPAHRPSVERIETHQEYSI